MIGVLPFKFFLGAITLTAILVSTSASAQGIRSATEEAREGEEIRGNTGVAEIREIERGVYVGVEFGANYFIPVEGDGFVLLNENFVSPGTRMGFRAGYDVSSQLSVEGFVLANFNKGLIKQDAIADDQLTGDLAHFAPGVAVRFSFLQADRIHLYGRGGLGYAIWVPGELAGGSFGSFHVEAGAGVEYFTRLRHISIGAEISVQGLLLPNAFGVHIYPTIKYTF